jgi:hypothetical protein
MPITIPHEPNFVFQGLAQFATGRALASRQARQQEKELSLERDLRFGQAAANVGETIGSMMIQKEKMKREEARHAQDFSDSFFKQYGIRPDEIEDEQERRGLSSAVEVLNDIRLDQSLAQRGLKRSLDVDQREEIGRLQTEAFDIHSNRLVPDHMRDGLIEEKMNRISEIRRNPKTEFVGLPEPDPQEIIDKNVGVLPNGQPATIRRDSRGGIRIEPVKSEKGQKAQGIELDEKELSALSSLQLEPDEFDRAANNLRAQKLYDRVFNSALQQGLSAGEAAVEARKQTDEFRAAVGLKDPRKELVGEGVDVPAPQQGDEVLKAAVEQGVKNLIDPSSPPVDPDTIDKLSPKAASRILLDNAELLWNGAMRGHSAARSTFVRLILKADEQTVKMVKEAFNSQVDQILAEHNVDTLKKLQERNNFLTQQLRPIAEAIKKRLSDA